MPFLKRTSSQFFNPPNKRQCLASEEEEPTTSDEDFIDDDLHADIGEIIDDLASVLACLRELFTDLNDKLSSKLATMT